MARTNKSKTQAAELLKQFESQFDETLNERMGHLHNRMVAFVAESRLPITHVITVLQMLLTEATDQALKKFMKE